MTGGADGHTHPYRFPCNAGVELPLARFSAKDRFELRQFPARAIGFDAADMGYSFMRIHSVAFVDAHDLNVGRHDLS